MGEKVWLTDRICYDPRRGYIMLQLPALPIEAITYDGTDFEPKQTLHVSLLATKNLAEYFEDPISANELLRKAVAEFVRNHSITFKSFKPQGYICENEDAKSIIVAAELQGHEALFSMLRANFAELSQLAAPAFHVTLYKYNHQYGIGIHNEAQLHAWCRPIPLEILPRNLQVQLREL